VVLDVATTVSSRQRVRVAAQQGTLMPEGMLVSRGGCITSALTDWSGVEVVGAVLGTVSSRARRGLGAVATR
jgi:LDH2 family malate/lactate/ureidoglycolate dehydrogenase